MQPHNDYLFFEKQPYFSLECGVHALNNLLSDPIFTKESLAQICKNLSGDLINPYQSVFGGDYDVTVLILALQQYQFPVRWLKKNENLAQILKLPLLKGLLINTEQKSLGSTIMKLFNQSGRHWSCLKRRGDTYYLLDSLQKEPLRFESDSQAIQLLESQRKQGATILVVQLPPVETIQANKDKSRKKRV